MADSPGQDSACVLDSNLAPRPPIRGSGRASRQSVAAQVTELGQSPTFNRAQSPLLAGLKGLSRARMLEGEER